MKNFEQMNEDERKVFLQGIAQEVSAIIRTRLSESEVNELQSDFNHYINYETYHMLKFALIENE